MSRLYWNILAIEEKIMVNLYRNRLVIKVKIMGWNFNFGNTPLDWIQELLE